VPAANPAARHRRHRPTACRRNHLALSAFHAVGVWHLRWLFTQYRYLRTHSHWFVAQSLRTTGEFVTLALRRSAVYSAGAPGGAPISSGKPVSESAARDDRNHPSDARQTAFVQYLGQPMALDLSRRSLLLWRYARDQLQVGGQARTGRSQPQSVNDLYAALWDQIIRAIGRAVVKHQTDDWPAYFSGLRDLTRKLVTESTANALSASQKAELTRRLTERIDELEKWWPSTDKNKRRASQAANITAVSESRDRVAPPVVPGRARARPGPV